MTTEKFISEIQTLQKFFELHCNDKHTSTSKYCKELIYNDDEINIELQLCLECITLIDYAFERLSKCPHNPKPRCRQCSLPCYEKVKWKQVSKIMRHSGIQLGILKMKRLMKFESFSLDFYK